MVFMSTKQKIMQNLQLASYASDASENTPKTLTVTEDNSILESTESEAMILVASGSGDTIVTGTKGVNDTLVSAGSGKHTTFYLNKGTGENTVVNFVFGGNEDSDDVVALDSSFSSNGLIMPSSGSVKVGFDDTGSLNLTGSTGQNEFAYNYGGNLGIANVDMSDGGMEMSFDPEANLYVGQGKNTSLVFKSGDFIAGTGNNGSFAGFGWNSPYISEGFGVIDGRNGLVAAINGDNVVDKVIYASTVVGASSSAAGNEVFLCGGLGENFSNPTADTLVGSENGNTTFYIGHKMGNDVITNAVDGDKIVLIDTKWNDITFSELGDSYIKGSASNGDVVTINSKNKLSELNNVTVQFDDVTLTAMGAKANAKNYIGNETVYVGKDLGNDFVYNVSSGDTITLFNTETTAISSYSYNDNYLSATFSNGAQSGFFTKEKLADINSVTLNFDNLTYKVVGNNTNYNYYNSTNDLIFGSGEGNSTFHVGKYYGNDIMFNVTSGDKIDFLSTKSTDIVEYATSTTGILALCSNGTLLGISCKNKMADEKDITLQFADTTYKWNGTTLVQE